MQTSTLLREPLHVMQAYGSVSVSALFHCRSGSEKFTFPSLQLRGGLPLYRKGALGKLHRDIIDVSFVSCIVPRDTRGKGIGGLSVFQSESRAERRPDELLVLRRLGNERPEAPRFLRQPYRCGVILPSL